MLVIQPTVSTVDRHRLSLVRSLSALQSTRGGRYAIALILLAAATLGRWMVDPLLGLQIPFAFHFAAIILVGWLTDLEVSLVATTISAVVVDYLFLDPRQSLIVSSTANRSAVAVFMALACGISWQTSRWRAAERALKQSRDEQQQRADQLQFQGTLLEQAYDAVFVLDADERIVLWNRAAEELYGWTAAEALGQSSHMLLGTDAATQDAVRESLDRSGVWSGQIAHRRKDGARVISDSRQVAVAAGFVLEVNRDVTDQRGAEDELREMSQRLSYHVEHSPLAVIEFGPDMRVTRWAGEAERLFGWAAEEVLGKRIEDFRWVYDEDLPAVSTVSKALETGTDPQRFSSNRNYRKDGSVVHCEWYNSSLVDASGKLQSILSLVLDVTERKRLETELREKAEELGRANRLKDEFLATLSHELRTPLNAILGWTHILSGGELSPERMRRGFETIARNARLQAQLVEDLLDVSRIVTGSLRLERRPIDLHVGVEQALEGIGPAADAKQLAITTDLDPDLTLVADPSRIQQVIWNLLSNAVKFTPPGGAIELTARRSAGQIQVVVRDTGTGISRDFLPHVFERFTQADSSPTRAHGGIGLGLAIVRHIVELHGGTVAAASEGEGRGAVFTIVLPIARAEPPVGHALPGTPSSPPADADRRRSLERARVLVVDDDADALEMMDTILRRAGATVALASSARHAEELLPQFKPDVLVSDIAMAVTDGYALIRRIRASAPPLASIPSIAVTAYGGAADRDAALAAGYDRHVAKPFVAEDLVTLVASLLRPGVS